MCGAAGGWSEIKLRSLKRRPIARRKGFCFIEDAFDVTIDEPSNATLQTGHLAFKANDPVQCGGAVARFIIVLSFT
jgi:hypothetical protein